MPSDRPPASAPERFRFRSLPASLRFRLTVLVLLAMLAAIGQSAYTSWERRRDAREEARAHALELARLASANLEGLVEGTRQLLVSFSQLPQVRGGDPQACEALLDELLPRFSLYAGFGLLDDAGQVTCSAWQLGSPAQISEQKLFQRARERRDFAVGGYAPGSIPEKVALDFGYPVVDDAGELRGVVFAAMDLAWLNLLAADAQLPEGSAFAVVHEDGTVLAHYPDPEKWVGRNLAGAASVRAGLRGAEGTAEVAGLDGQPRLYAFRPLRGAVGSEDLHVSVGVPLSVAFADADREMVRNLLVLGLVAILALAGTAVVGEAFVLRPVRALLRATRRLSQGDLDVRTGPPYRGGELGQLARAFDEMAGALQERRDEAARAEESLRHSRDELEARVAERTREISQANDRLSRELEERQRIAEALRASEERFKAFMDNNPAVGFMKDEEGRFIYCNARFETLFHVRPDEILGKTGFELWPEDVARALRENDLAVLASGQSVERLERVPTPDGVDRHWMVFKFPIRAESGRQILGGVAIDVTARLQAEEDLRHANEELKRWVGELERRTRQITQLSEMADLLQSCQTPEESYAVITQSAQQLFPSYAGALCMFTASRNVVESVSAWGPAPTGERVFHPDDCWALRRGQVHVVSDPRTELVCGHLSKPVSGPYLCVPMMAQGQALGMLHLVGGPEANAAEGKAEGAEATRKLATAVAEQVALAIANMRLRETLRYQAIRDPLTGLFNRRYMEESLERELHRAARRQTSVGVVMLDLDRFKSFNDAFGHAAGDTLLRELGAFIRAHLRGEDIACRYGGEEFTLILPDADLEQTRERAEELRQGARHLTVLHHGQTLAAITLSLGVAAFPDSGASVEEILSAADAALYDAKAAGRDRVTVAAGVE
jgi:diguanylate cyclase (GGDEF)-like protein/PAS domain S-box-containing protein